MDAAMSKQGRAKENKNPNCPQVCDKRICLCVCCIPDGLYGKARVACACVYNKCKCARSCNKDKESANNFKPNPQPSKFIIVQEDPSIPSLKHAFGKKSTSNQSCNN